MKKVTIYTDGACSGNPGPGGWGAVLIYNKLEKKISGSAEQTTNNRMEILAVIKSLEILKQKCIVDLYTDSNYIYKAFTENWIERWINNNWKGSNKKEIANKDLWTTLIEVSSKHKIHWKKVKGHSNDKYNDIADELATSMIKRK